MSAAPGTTAVPTRDRIVEAALRLFSERGTTAVSMRELADAAGVTVPGLYYHFASKAELIREVYRAQGFGQEPGEIELPDARAGRDDHRRARPGASSRGSSASASSSASCSVRRSSATRTRSRWA